QDQQLREVQIQIANLGGEAIGRETGEVIELSDTAAGYGWFVDTPFTFRNGFGASTANGLVAGPDSPAAGHMDLATVIAHEMGHVLGFEHTATPGDVMGPFLATAMRRQPTALDVAAAFISTG